MRVCHLTKYVHARGGSDFSEPSLFYEREMKMKQYIPDITERFPEGYGGVDMTPAYFGEPVDWSRAYQREKEDYEDRDIDAERDNERRGKNDVSFTGAASEIEA